MQLWSTKDVKIFLFCVKENSKKNCAPKEEEKLQKLVKSLQPLFLWYPRCARLISFNKTSPKNRQIDIILHSFLFLNFSEFHRITCLQNWWSPFPFQILLVLSRRGDKCPDTRLCSKKNSRLDNKKKYFALFVWLWRFLQITTPKVI